jgi:hypothetical protein
VVCDFPILDDCIAGLEPGVVMLHCLECEGCLLLSVKEELDNDDLPIPHGRSGFRAVNVDSYRFGQTGGVVGHSGTRGVTMAEECTHACKDWKHGP